MQRKDRKKLEHASQSGSLAPSQRELLATSIQSLAQESSLSTLKKLKTTLKNTSSPEILQPISQALALKTLQRRAAGDVKNLPADNCNDLKKQNIPTDERVTPILDGQFTKAVKYYKLAAGPIAKKRPIQKTSIDAKRHIQEASPYDPNAQYYLALCYENGIGIPCSLSAYLYYMEEAAEKRHLLAIKHQVDYYFQLTLDKNIPSDLRILYLTKAAELGSSDAMLELGQAYDFGLYSVTKDMPTALKWYEQAAQMNHKAAAMYALFMKKNNLISRHNSQLIEQMLQEGKKAKDAFCLYALAAFYNRGGILVECNKELTFKYLSQAAELGHKEACRFLGKTYMGDKEFCDIEKDLSKMKNAKEGEKWLRAAVALGSKEALNDLKLHHVKELPEFPPDQKQASQSKSKCEGGIGDIADINGVPHIHIIRFDEREALIEQLNEINFKQLEEAATQEDPYAKKILHLLNKVGLTSEVHELMISWGALEARGKKLFEPLDDQIKFCYKKYNLSMLDEKETASAKKKKKGKSKPEIPGLSPELALQKSKDLFENQIVKEDIYLDEKITNEIAELKNQVNVENENEINTRIALCHMVVNNLKAARDIIFNRLDYKKVGILNRDAEQSLFYAAVNVLRALQGDTKRAEEDAKNSVKMSYSVQNKPALAIIQYKMGKYLLSAKKLKSFNLQGADPLFKKILSKLILKHLETLSDAEAFEHLKMFKSLQDEEIVQTYQKLEGKLGSIKKISEACPEVECPTVECPAVSEHKVDRSLSSNIPDKGDAKANDSVPDVTSIDALMTHLIKNNRIADEKVEIGKVQIEELDPKLLTYSIPSEVDNLYCKLQQWVARKLEANKDCLNGKEDPVRIAGSVNRKIAEAVLEFQKEKLDANKLKVKLDVNKLEAKKKKIIKSCDDFDIALSLPISADELRAICREAKLPEPFNPDGQGKLLQLKIKNYKVDIRCDHEDLSCRDFTPNSLMAVRENNGRYRIKDLHPEEKDLKEKDPKEKDPKEKDLKDRGLKDIVLGIARPLTPISEWPKKAAEENESGYWVRLLKLTKLMSNDYKLLKEDALAILPMVLELKDALKNPNVAGHINNHLKKIFLSGQAEASFRVMVDLGMIPSIFPFLAHINFKSESLDFKWMIQNLKMIDKMHNDHLANPRMPHPSSQYIYAMFIGLGLYHEFKKDFQKHLSEKVKQDPALNKRKNLRAKLYTLNNQLFDINSNQKEYIQKIIRETSLFNDSFETISKGGVNGLWLIRHHTYFRLDKGIAKKELSFDFKPDISSPTNVGLFKTDGQAVTTSNQQTVVNPAQQAMVNHK